MKMLSTVEKTKNLGEPDASTPRCFYEDYSGPALRGGKTLHFHTNGMYMRLSAGNASFHIQSSKVPRTLVRVLWDRGSSDRRYSDSFVVSN